MTLPNRPLFAPDESTPAQQALSQRVLRVTTLAMAIFTGIGTAAAIFINWQGLQDSSFSVERIIPTLLIAVVFAVAHQFATRGGRRVAMVMVVLAIFLWVANAVFRLGLGTNSLLAPGLIVLIYITGLICGKREGWLVTGMAVTLYGLGGFADYQGWLGGGVAGSGTANFLIACSIVSGWLVASFSDTFHIVLSQAEQSAGAAEQSARALRDVTDATPATITKWSPDEICLFANAPFLKFLGRNASAVIGRSFREFMPAAAIETSLPHLHAAFKGEAQRFEVSGMLNGTERFFIVSYIPQYTNGVVTAALSVGIDVTEAHAMEKVLAERTRQAESASVAKSQFLATMSHELRTPLNGILGNAELLGMVDFTEEERRAALNVIVRSGKSLLATFNRTLDLANIESGQLLLRHDLFDLASLLRDLCAAHAQQAQTKGLRVHIDADPEHSWMVEGDQQRVYQIMANLFNNAIKFSERGEITLELKRPDENDASLIELSVTDQGIGIAADDLGRLFQSFVQVDGSAARRYEGTGLGLVIVRRLAEYMDGGAGVTSAPGQGSRFWVRLRLAPALLD